MIQFNLLPDVKLEYIKTRRIKRLVMLISSLVTAVAASIMILLILTVNVLQKQHLKDLTANIKKDSNAIKETPDIEKILTIQTQLTSLPDLHKKKPVASRLFDYVKQVTPANASIARLEVKFADGSILITGSADSLGTVNKFVDTLKFTEFKSGETNDRAFYGVVLTTFGRDTKGASYTIDLKFKPAIFDSANAVSLTIPSIITTRSQIDKPGALFQPLSNPDTQPKSNAR